MPYLVHNFRILTSTLRKKTAASKMAQLVAKAAPSVISGALELANRIYTMLLEMQYGDRIRDGIFRKIEDIKSQLVKLQNHSDDDFTADMKTALNDAYVRLEACEMECRKIADQNCIVRFFKSASNLSILNYLQAELSSVHVNLGNQILCAMSEQLSIVKQQSRKDEETSLAGVYHVKRGVLNPPAKVSRPVVDIEGKQMIISWEDDDNPPGSIFKYEMRLDDSTNSIIPTDDANCKCLSIGPPKVEPGVVYTIQVRGINGRGPGEWSDATIARYKTGLPNKPKKPKVTPGYNDATIDVLVPGIKETNGAPVSQIIVQYCEYDNSSEWTLKSFCIEDEQQGLQHSRAVTVPNLSPYTRYFFRIVLVNEYGESAPSESADATTNIPIPGKPTEVRRSFNSSYYTSSVLKIHWKPPEEYAQFVDHYVVEYKKKKKEFDIRHKFDVIVTEKLSATAKELSSDTKYAFYVWAVNKNGECSEKVRIEAETKWKTATKIALSPLVFLGTTVGAPVIGAAAGAFGVGLLAAESIDSKAGAVAGGVGAGVAGGIGGAIGGIMGAPGLGAMLTLSFVLGEDFLLFDKQCDDDD